MAGKKKSIEKVESPNDRMDALEEKLSGLESAMDRVVDLLEKKIDTKASAPETEESKAIAAAAPNRYTTNPEWEEEAKKILGEYLDHTEVEHERTGGIKFTVVIKKEKSNAPRDYLALAGIDRRTKEVSASGMEGVAAWCKLIRSNLKRTEAK